MRKLAAVVTSGIVLGALVVPGAAWGHGDFEDFTVYAKITDFDREDNGHEGFSEGDKITVTADLYDESREQVGDSKGVCEVVEFDKEAEEFEADCKILLDLEDGKLKMAGTITHDDFVEHDVRLPIEGGTDEYDGAHGEATFERLRYHASHDGGHGKDHGDGHGGHGHGHGDYHDPPIIKISVDFD